MRSAPPAITYPARQPVTLARPMRLLTGCTDERPADGRGVGSGRYLPVMANFAVMLVHGPGWDSSRQIQDQDAWEEHAAFMDRLVDEGFIILGGPVGGGE